MAWNGSGVFSRLRSWAADAANGLHVQADLMDQDTDDIAAAINNCLTKDGQNAATENLPMGGHRHTGVSAGAARDQYATVGQLQDGTPRYCVAGGTANALTLTLFPAVTDLVDGMEINFKASATCAAGATTAAVNAVAAKSVKRPDGANLAEGDIVSGRDYTLRYVAATDAWTLRHPSLLSVSAVAGLQTALDAKAAANLSNVANVDFANKASAAGVGGGFAISGVITISGNTSITQAAHAGKALRVTAAALLTFPPAGSFVGSCLIYNQTGSAITLTSSSGVNGASSWVVLGGQSAIVVGDGTQYLATSGGPALTWMVNFTPGGIAGLATLSADAMTATGGADAWRAARTAALPTTGVYFEMHVIGKGGDDGVFGVDGATYDGGTHALVAGRAFNGQIITTGGYGAATWPAASAGTVVGVAISADNKMWMSHNNNWVGSPSAGTSPSWTGLPASRAVVARLRWSADAVRLVFAGSALAYAPPAGFAAIQS